MSTPHNAAQKGDIAKTVLMPGDPLRAKFIAENYLEGPVLYNDIRGMYGYTGTYNGKRVSVQGSGMGAPSIGIYSYELYNFYEVENIIRIGTAGAIAPRLKVGDVVLAQGACTNSNFASGYNLPGHFAPIASARLMLSAHKYFEDMGIEPIIGNVLTSDLFYDDDETAISRWRKMGVLAVEMEAAALYMIAARAGKNALALLTISDIIGGAEAMSPADRQTAVTRMIEAALEIAP